MGWACVVGVVVELGGGGSFCLHPPQRASWNESVMSSGTPYCDAAVSIRAAKFTCGDR